MSDILSPEESVHDLTQEKESELIEELYINLFTDTDDPKPNGVVEYTPLMSLIRRWLTNLPAETELEFVSAIRNLSTVTPIQRWSLFGGSGVGGKFFARLSAVLADMYDIHVAFPPCVIAEHENDKRMFLHDQSGCGFIVDKVSELASESAMNTLDPTGESTLLPFCRAIDGGFPCKARSSLNNNRKANLHCVRQQRASTGEGFAETLEVVLRHVPDMVLLECVTELQESGDDGESDAEYIVNAFRQHNYWALCVQVDARDWGSFVSRIRAYWPALGELKDAPSEDITFFFTKIMNSLKLGKQLPWDPKSEAPWKLQLFVETFLFYSLCVVV